MRHLLLPVCLVGLCLTAAPRASADDAPGCDILCRVTGYLTSDHMAAAPGEVETPHGAPAKQHRSRGAAARKTAASTTVDKAGTGAVRVAKAAPSTAAAKTERPRPTSATMTAVVAKAAAPRPATAAVVASAPARLKRPQRASASRRAADRHVAELTPPVAPTPRVTRAPSVRHQAKVSRLAARPPAPPRTQTAAALIPGSAPTMPAGFH